MRTTSKENAPIVWEPVRFTGAELRVTALQPSLRSPCSEPLLIKHKRVQQLLDCSGPFYWGLVKRSRIRVVGLGRASRADYASVLEYVAAEARARQAA
jgi:hypothetical protein